MFGKIFSWFWRKKWCFFLIFLLGFLVSLYWLIPIFGPIRPEKASNNLLVTWLLVRDFEKLSPEKIDALVKRFDNEYGFPSGKRIEFAFSDYVKTQIRKSMERHYEGIVEQAEMIHDKEKLLAYPITRQERNIQLLFRTWFLNKQFQWEQTPADRQPDFLKAFARELGWWQDFYMDFLKAANVSIPPIQMVLQEFEVMFVRWQATVEPELIPRMDAFKKEMQRAVVSEEISRRMNRLKTGWNRMLQPGNSGKSERPTVPWEETRASTAVPSDYDPLEVFSQ